MISLILLCSAESYAQTTTIEDLAIHCEGIATTIAVSDFHYDPGLPPHARFPGIPPSSSAKMTVDLAEFSKGCQVLDEKYDYHLKQLTLDIAILPAVASIDLSALVGQTTSFQISQSFGFTLKGQYLPFYPDLVDETIELKTSSISLGSHSILGYTTLSDIDIHQAHGISSIEQKSDEELLQIADKVISVANHSPYSAMFGRTLLLLEPEGNEEKSEYANQLWAYLHSLKSKGSTPPGFFNFHVGGSGSFEGAPISGKILELHGLHQALSDAALVAYVVEFPTAFLALQNSCASLTDEIAEEIVTTLYDKIPIMNENEKFQTKALFIGANLSLNPCGYNLKATPAAAATVDKALVLLQ